MDLDANVCYCFHVTKRKLLAYIRVEKPRVASQLAECGGAGTGCGWCVPFLRELFGAPGAAADLERLSTDEYARRRAEYIRSGQGKPPPPCHSATPLPAEDPPQPPS